MAADPAAAPPAEAPPARASTAAPLAWAWTVLIVYASLHPFTDWTWPAAADWGALWLPWPRYWSRLDVVFNLLAYLPLGFLAGVAHMRAAPRRAGWGAVGQVALAAAALSLAMEWLQILLPMRVPSRADWLLNSAGGALGALAALGVVRRGWLAAWHRLWAPWLSTHHGAGVALLLLWPAALLVPPPLPMGLGPVWLPLARTLQEWADGTPLAAWMPQPDASLFRLSPGIEMVATALGFLLPCFVAFSFARRGRARALLLAGAVALGLGAMTLSTLLNFGPEHADAWWSAPVAPALAVAVAAALALLRLSQRWVAVLGLLGVMLHVVLVNQVEADPYFAANLQDWEQGRFIRFHGVTQWLAWAWPYAALAFLMQRVAGRDDDEPGASPAR